MTAKEMCQKLHDIYSITPYDGLLSFDHKDKFVFIYVDKQIKIETVQAYIDGIKEDYPDVTFIVETNNKESNNEY